MGRSTGSGAYHILCPLIVELTLKDLQVKPVQNNSYDCGLWTLSWIAAVLRGYDTQSEEVWTENCMPVWRNFLGTVFRSYPCRHAS